MNFVIIIGLSVVLAIGAVRFATRFLAEEGSVLQRLYRTAYGSATVLWGWITALGGYSVVYAGQVAELLNAPEVKDWLKANLEPEYVGLAILAIGLITLWARFSRNPEGVDVTVPVDAEEKKAAVMEALTGVPPEEQ